MKDLLLYQSKDNMLFTQKPGQGDRPTGYTRNHKRQYVKPQIVTLNVGTMRRRSTEIAEMLSWGNVDICCAGNLLEGQIGSTNYGKELSL